MHLGACCLLQASHDPIGCSRPAGQPPDVLSTSWQLLPCRNVWFCGALPCRLLLRRGLACQGSLSPGHVLAQGGGDMGRHLPAVSVCGGKPLPSRMPDGERDYVSRGYILKHVGDLQLLPMRTGRLRQYDGIDRVLAVRRGRNFGGECLCVHLWCWLRGRRIRALLGVWARQGRTFGSWNMPEMRVGTLFECLSRDGLQLLRARHVYECDGRDCVPGVC